MKPCQQRKYANLDSVKGKNNKSSNIYKNWNVSQLKKAN